jgi:hypothetical protein
MKQILVHLFHLDRREMEVLAPLPRLVGRDNRVEQKKDRGHCQENLAHAWMTSAVCFG